MPYCSKCGIEVDNGIEKCPLCGYTVPVFNDEEIKPKKYPKQINKYPHYRNKKRNFAFNIVMIVLISAGFMNMIQNLIYSDKLTWSLYSAPVIFFSIIYVYFSFGFIRSFFKITVGIMLNTLAMLFVIDIVNRSMTFFTNLALPIVLTTGFFVMADYYLIRKFKNKGLNIIGTGFISVSLICLLYEIIIDTGTSGKIFFNWSTIIFFQLMPIGVFS